MNIDIPAHQPNNIEQIPGIYRIEEKLPNTTKRILLRGRDSHTYIFCPSIENIKEINHILGKSFSGYCLIAFPEKEVLYTMSACDDETEALMQLLQNGDALVARGFAEQYMKQAGRLVPKEFIMGDGKKVVLIRWEDNPLDEL